MICFEVNSGVTTYVKSLADKADTIITFNGGVKYDVRYCGDYAIYYLNSYGGWDSFLIEGKVKKFDDFTQYEYNKSFDNNTLQFEKTRYMNEIKTRYEMNTGWLTDEQAENLAKNLLGSTKLYVHNLVDDRIFPAIITDSSVEYKTFRNNGRLVSYTINVQESQGKIRK